MKKILSLLLILSFLSDLLAQESWIRVNQVGYKSGDIKVAVLGSKEKIKVDYFELINILNDKVEFKSNIIKQYPTYACFTEVYRLDFTNFNRVGTYYIRVNNIISPNILISDNPYKGTADFVLNYMRQQRCGYNPYLKDSCHTQDGFIVDHPELDSTFINVVGGWHDASDYLQYVATSANATYQMLFAFQQNPYVYKDMFDKDGNPGSNGIPDILDEAKWGLDWLNEMNPVYGMMFNQIADDRDHRKFTLPTLDTIKYGKGLERPVYFVTGKSQGLAKYKNRTTGVSSTAAKYASAFALGSELLKEYYPEFCEHISEKAKDAFRFSKTDLGVCQTASNVSPYFYEEDNYADDMELAAAQLALTHNDNDYLVEAAYWGDIEPVTPWMGADTARHYQWYPFVNLGHYLLAESSDTLLRKKFLRFMRQGIEKVYQRGKDNGFLMGVPFIWCSNNLIVAILTQISLYKKLTNDTKYDEMESALRDWLFGCNPWGTSMVVGFPKYGDTPVDPHSAFTAVFDHEINGGLVDGPVYASIFNKLIGLKIYNGDEYSEFQSDLCVYHDDYGDYSTNEPTMDGTASLSYYLSSLEEVDNSYRDYSISHGGIIRGNQNLKNIHLIFTGGDYNDGGLKILETLRKNRIKAHFFFTGDFYRNPENQELIYNFKNDGHYLGAHSDKHLLYASWENRDSLLVTKKKFISDLKGNYLEMEKFGISPNDALLFLPPFEWYNNEISSWIDELGLTLINFTPGTLSNADYTTPEMKEKYRSSEEIYNSILDYEKNDPKGLNGFILLFHVGSHPHRTDKFYKKLNQLITKLKYLDYTFKIFEP